MSWRLAGDSYGGSAGPPGPPGPAGSGTVLGDTLTNDNAGTLAIGTPLYSKSANKVDTARANAAATAIVIGLATGPATTGNPIAFQSAGLLSLTTAQWDLRTGDVGGLVAGTQYWLDPAAVGKLVKVAPAASTNYVTLVGQALNTTDMMITLNDPIGPIP